jgi:hypothetical protein
MESSSMEVEATKSASHASESKGFNESKHCLDDTSKVSKELVGGKVGIWCHQVEMFVSIVSEQSNPVLDEEVRK